MCPSEQAWIPPFPSPPERADVAVRPSPRSPQPAGRTLAHVSSCPRERRACRSGRPLARGAGDRAKAGRSAFFGLGFLKTTWAIRIHFVFVSVRPIWVRFCKIIPRFTAGHFWCRPSPTTCVVSPSPLTPPLAHKAERGIILYSHIHSFLLSSVSPTATDKAQDSLALWPHLRHLCSSSR